MAVTFDEIKSIVENENNFSEFMKQITVDGLTPYLAFCGTTLVDENVAFIGKVLNYYKEDFDKTYCCLSKFKRNYYAKSVYAFLDDLAKNDKQFLEKIVAQYWKKRDLHSTLFSNILSLAHENDIEGLFNYLETKDKRLIALRAIAFLNKEIVTKYLEDICAVFEEAQVKEKEILIGLLLENAEHQRAQTLILNSIGINSELDSVLDIYLFRIKSREVYIKIFTIFLQKSTSINFNMVCFNVVRMAKENNAIGFGLLLELITRFGNDISHDRELVKYFSTTLSLSELGPIMNALEKNKTVKTENLFEYMACDIVASLYSNNSAVLIFYLKRLLSFKIGKKVFGKMFLMEVSKEQYNKIRGCKEFELITIIEELSKFIKEILASESKKFRERPFSNYVEYFEYFYYLAEKLFREKFDYSVVKKNITKYPNLEKYFSNSLDKKITEGYEDNLILIYLSRLDMHSINELKKFNFYLGCLLEKSDPLGVIRDNLFKNDQQTEDMLSELRVMAIFRQFPELCYRVNPKVNTKTPDGAFKIQRDIYSDVIHPKLDSDLAFGGTTALHEFNGFEKIAVKTCPDSSAPYLVIVDASGSEKDATTILNALYGPYQMFFERDGTTSELKFAGDGRNIKQAYPTKARALDISTISAIAIFKLALTNEKLRFITDVITNPYSKIQLNLEEIQKIQGLFATSLSIS